MTPSIDRSQTELQPADAATGPVKACACDPATCLQRQSGRCCRELLATEPETPEQPQAEESADRQA